MNILNKCFVLLELLVQFLSAGSYTVVLKHVKPLHPPVKVYRYELHPKFLPSNSMYIYQKALGQRIYPVAKDGNYKTRVPVKKEKGKKNHPKVSSTAEILSSGRSTGLSQHLVPPVSNQIEEYSDAKEEENDIRPLAASINTGKSFSSFGQEKGRIYNNPGEWATPPPKADSDNTTKAEFTPSQLYLQIRHKNTVIHVPQSEALKDAETLEELINAPRLKQLSRTTHVQETYSEEGYEDAGYDHAGHLRQAQHGEVYDAKDEGVFKIKEPPVILDYDSNSEESKKVPTEEIKELDEVERNLTNKLEPRTIRSKTEVIKPSVEYTKIPKNYKGDHKYSSRVKKPVKTIEESDSRFNLTENVPLKFPEFFTEMSPAVEGTPQVKELVPPAKISSKYRKGDLNSTEIFAVPQSTSDSFQQVTGLTDFKPYISMIDSQASPSAKSLKYSRIYSKKTKQLRLEPYKNENAYLPPPLPTPKTVVLPPHPDFQTSHRPIKTVEEEPINERIVLPTIGYINSLTTAHFAKGNTKTVQDEPKAQLTDALNLTQALNYLRSNQNQKNTEVTKAPTEIDIRTFEPMKIKKSRNGFIGKRKRDVYLMREGERRSDDEIKSTGKEDYEGSEDSDAPFNEKTQEIEEEEKKRIEEENQEKEKYESDLREEISNQEKTIIRETYKNIGVEEDISEVFPEFPHSETEPDSSYIPLETTTTPVDVKKYPFYKSKNLPENSALRYATDPSQFPKKSGYKMEFYESRDRLIQCPDFHPNLENLPNSNSTEYSEEQPGEGQRLTGLGDKILCLRMKFFDPEPFDNPIFKEKEIDYVGKPVKGRKKVKISPKTPRVNKDQKLQQSGHQQFYTVKPNNPKRNVQFNSLASAVKHNYTPQPVIPLFSYQTNTSTEIPRIIPVTEIVDELPPQQIKVTQRKQKTPVIGWKTTYRSFHPHRLHSKPLKITKPSKCLPILSKIPVLDGTRNLTIDCEDATLIQEVANNAARLRIIPKETKTQTKVVQRKWNEIKSKQSPDQTDWVPIRGYTLPKYLKVASVPFGRRTDVASEQKNETTVNSTAVYVIDELKEDEKVRKGEVVEDMDHYMKMMTELKDEMIDVTTVKPKNSTRKKREAQNDAETLQRQNNFGKAVKLNLDLKTVEKMSTNNDTENPLQLKKSKLLEQKRPLRRLSGLDFLTRYHKNKGKSTAQKAEDFWRIASTDPISKINKNAEKSQKKIGKSEKPLQSTSKAKDKIDSTMSPQRRQEKIKNPDIKRTSDRRKNPTNTSGEIKTNKHKANPTNEPRKISPLNLIPEKITKKPEIKASDFWKTFSQNTEVTPKPAILTKIITKVSKETSESSEKPRIVYKKSNQTSPVENRTVKTTSTKPELPEHTTPTINLPPNNSSRPTESPEGSVLYYVVNLKTGRGKWITNYDERTGKYRKPEKLIVQNGSGL